MISVEENKLSSKVDADGDGILDAEETIQVGLRNYSAADMWTRSAVCVDLLSNWRLGRLLQMHSCAKT